MSFHRPAALGVLIAAISVTSVAEAGPPPPAQLHTPRMSASMQERVDSEARPRLTNNAMTDHAKWVAAKEPVFAPSLRNTPRAIDVHQGSYLGDCYFESPMAAVAAKNPNWVKSLVHENADNTVTVRLFVRDHKDKLTGKWTFTPVEQTFDRKLPATKDGRVYSPGRALWPAFIQLAYAKLAGGYTKLNQGGLGSVGLEMLTGREAEYAEIDPIKDAKVGEKIRAALRAGKPVVIGTRSQDELMAALAKVKKQNPAVYAKVKAIADNPENALERLGLVASHEYHVLGSGSKDGHDLTVVRNPWGSFKPPPKGLGSGPAIEEGNGVFPIDDDWLPLVYGDVAIGEIPE